MCTSPALEEMLRHLHSHKDMTPGTVGWCASAAGCAFRSSSVLAPLYWTAQRRLPHDQLAPRPCPRPCALIERSAADGGGTNVGAIAGGIGAAVVIAVIACCLFWFCCWKKRKQGEKAGAKYDYELSSKPKETTSTMRLNVDARGHAQVLL